MQNETFRFKNLRELRKLYPIARSCPEMNPFVVVAKYCAEPFFLHFYAISRQSRCTMSLIFHRKLPVSVVSNSNRSNKTAVWLEYPIGASQTNKVHPRATDTSPDVFMHRTSLTFLSPGDAKISHITILVLIQCNIDYKNLQRPTGLGFTTGEGRSDVRSS